MQRGILMDEAIEIVSKTCAYTNHTILAEALEKWPIHFLEKAVPQLLPIIYELNSRVVRKYDDKSVAIIDDEKRVHMAHMDIHYGYSVNGVAYLHTEILKNTELNNFYKIYPEKFNNKTNGITFRRWLLHCNHELADLIESLIGPGFKKDAMELEKLGALVDDASVLQRLLDVKSSRKTELKDYLAKTQGIVLDDNSIYDIQIKRLHEYKRQQMNALYVIHKYFEIKAGKKPTRPITVIFGAKAAPAYVIAKDIIHLILCLSELIAKDPEVSPYLKVVMVENYNVTLAEKLIPAADIHEQISLASKEASGTSNMKFMLNGAVAIGTMDGANVEMHQFVGDDNIYIFGESSEEVIKHYEKADYVSRSYYENDANIKRAVDFIVSDEMMAVGCRENLERLYNELLNKDWFMTLPDFEEYVAAKERIFADYEDRMAWANQECQDISLITCHDETLCVSWFPGMDGALIGFAGCVPEIICPAREVFANPDKHTLKEAQDWSDRIYHISQAIYGGGQPSGEAHARLKEALKQRGIFKSALMRKPVLPLNDEEKAWVALGLERSQLPEVDMTQFED